MSDALEYAINSLRRAADSNHEWTLYPAEASALVAEIDRLRGQRRLENEDLQLAYDMARQKERAAVVAWLRTRPGYGPVADAIENGEHRREENDETADIVAEAVAQERAAVVEWLYRDGCEASAERIERGEHRRGEGA